MMRLVTTLVALGAAFAAVPAALWWSTTEHHTAASARAVTAQATPDDLVLLDVRLAGPQPNSAGLMRPFGSLATAVLEPQGPPPDLTTFPQKRAFVVGALDPGTMGLTQVEHLNGQTVMGSIPHTGQPVVSLVDRVVASVEKDGVVTPCTQRHPSGGVRCGAQGWQYVGPVVVTARAHLVACLWTHTIHQHVLHLDVPVGAGPATVWFQFADDALRDAPHPAVEVAAWQGGNALTNTSCLNQGDGRCALQLPPLAAGTLRLDISTPDAARQLLCLGGEVTPP